MNRSHNTGSFGTSKMKLSPAAPPPPIYVKYRLPILAVLVIAGGFRYWTSQDKATNFGDRVEKTQAERDRMQHEQDEKMKAAEERRKRGPASAGGATVSGALAAPGGSPNAAAATQTPPASPEELKTEAMFVFALSANGPGLRFKLKAGSSRAQLDKVKLALGPACLVPAGAAATCPAPIALDKDAWAALATCAAVETLAPNVARVVPARKYQLNLDKHALEPIAESAPVDVELDDVLWKDAAACAAFAKLAPAPIAPTKIYALGRGVP